MTESTLWAEIRIGRYQKRFESAVGTVHGAGEMNIDPKTVFHLARNGEALGERTQEEILFSLRLGELKPDDLAWRDGMAEWLPISSIPELAQPENSATAPAPTPVSSAAPAAVVVTETASTEPLLSPAETRPTPEGEAPPLASLGARFIGAVADGLIFFAAVLVPVLIIDGPQVLADDAAEPSDLATLVMVIVFVAFAVLQLVLLSTRGQSLGKILARTRIHLHSTGEKAGFVHAVLLRGIVGTLPSNIPILGFVYWIVNICFIFRADRRCLHDLIGGTIVCEA